MWATERLKQTDKQTDRQRERQTDTPATRLLRRLAYLASAGDVFWENPSHFSDLCRTTDSSSSPVISK